MPAQSIFSYGRKASGIAYIFEKSGRLLFKKYFNNTSIQDMAEIKINYYFLSFSSSIKR